MFLLLSNIIIRILSCNLVIEEVTQNVVLFLHSEGDALIHFLVMTLMFVLVKKIVLEKRKV